MSSPTLIQPNDDAETLESQRFRSHVGQISRQSGVFFAGTVFTAALAYFFKIYLARALGAEALGIYALGTTLIGFVGIFNALGLPDAAMRFVSQYVAAGEYVKLHALLWRGAGTLLVANFLFALALLAGGPWVARHFYHSTALAHYIPWFAAIMLVGVLTHFYGKVLAGYHGIARRSVIVSFIGSPFNVLVAVILIASGYGLGGYLAAQVISALLVLLLLFGTAYKLTPAAARFNAQRGQPLQTEVISFSTTLIGSGLMEFVMGQMDKVSLGHFRGPREVGVYSVAAAFVAYIPIILYSVNQLFSSMISGLHTTGEVAMLRRLFQALTKWVVTLTLPLAVVIIVFAPAIMRLFGSDFERGWPILIIGTLAQLVNCGVGSVGMLLLMSGNEKRLVRVQFYMAIVMLILNLALVPKWGIVGAAIAAACTTVGMNVWNLLEVRRALAMHPYNRSYLKLVPAAIAAILVGVVVRYYAYIFGHNWLTVGVALLLAYCVFAAVVLALGLDRDDSMVVRAVAGRIASLLGRSLPPAQEAQ